jgi:hypothetical protein
MTPISRGSQVHLGGCLRGLVPLLFWVGLLLAPGSAAALMLVLAADAEAAPGQCRGILSATATAPVDLALEGLAARDLRRGRDLPIQSAVRGTAAAEPTALLSVAFPGQCGDIRVSLAALSCVGGPCAPAAQSEVFGFAGLRLPPADPSLLEAAVAAAGPVSVREVFAAMMPPGPPRPAEGKPVGLREPPGCRRSVFPRRAIPDRRGPAPPRTRHRPAWRGSRPRGAAGRRRPACLPRLHLRARRRGQRSRGLLAESRVE